MAEAEQQIASIMREYVDAFNQRDAEKALSFLAEDAEWDTPEGVFRGKDEMRRYLSWTYQENPEATLKEAGIGIVVQGNKAAYEHIIEGTTEGVSWSIPAMCAYEFVGDKISRVLLVEDRLSIAKQAAKGFLPKTVVNAVVNRAERGLR